MGMLPFFLPRSRRVFFNQLYKLDRIHPYASPLNLPDEKFQDFPPTCVHVAGMDPLRDEGLLFAQKLTKAGVKTMVEIYSGFSHAFMNLPQLRESGKWREDLYEAVRWLRAQNTRAQT